MEKQHKKLTLEEREQISVLKASGNSLREIARLLGRNHSTPYPGNKKKRYSNAQTKLLSTSTSS